MGIRTMIGRPFFALLVTTAIVLGSPTQAADPAGSVIYSEDFSGYRSGSVLKWLGSKGFQPKQDATNTSKISYVIEDGVLQLEAKQRAMGLLINETNFFDATDIRIDWGVNAFPPGASYEKGVRSESIMVYVFFGDKKVSSGSMLVPDSPYFIGLMLCESGKTDYPYTGRYFKAGGRYVCVNQTTAGTPMVSIFPIAESFQKYFDQATTPPISGFAISIDTDSAKGPGTAKSFITKIEFLR